MLIVLEHWNDMRCVVGVLCLVCCFFFKQKTAYEMRISDWSSDVCSSDLLHTTETTGWPGYKSGASAPTLTYHPRQRAWRQHNYLDTSARALVDPKIGRASCRERVGQYV